MDELTSTRWGLRRTQENDNSLSFFVKEYTNKLHGHMITTESPINHQPNTTQGNDTSIMVCGLFDELIRHSNPSQVGRYLKEEASQVNVCNNIMLYIIMKCIPDLAFIISLV